MKSQHTPDPVARQVRLCSVEGCEYPPLARGYCSSHYRRFRNGDPLDAPMRRLNDPPKHCSVPGCGRPHKCQGYCNAHYERHRQGRPLEPPIVPKTPLPPTCTAPNCKRKAFARGLCGPHYRKEHPTPISEVQCLVTGCDKPAKCKGYCHGHDGRVRAGLPVETLLRPRNEPPPVCTAPGCERRPTALGYCELHYGRIRQGIPLEGRPRKVRASCSVDGCDHPSKWGGLCGGHAFRLRQYGDVGGASLKSRIPDGAACTVTGCDRPQAFLGLCNLHGNRKLKNGETGPVDPINAPAGAGSVDKNGYRTLQIDGKPYLEHRLVMQQILGRDLLPTEHVHHRNGDRSWNDPANLELWSTNHPYGQRVSDLIAFVCQYYPEQVRDELERDASERSEALPQSPIQLSLLE